MSKKEDRRKKRKKNARKQLTREVVRPALMASLAEAGVTPGNWARVERAKQVIEPVNADLAARGAPARFAVMQVAVPPSWDGPDVAVLGVADAEDAGSLPDAGLLERDAQ